MYDTDFSRFRRINAIPKREIFIGMTTFSKTNTVAEINLSNLICNLGNIEKRVAPSKVIAVVKADAYGHGAVPVAKKLSKSGVEFFAVTQLKEALELQNAGIAGSILLLGRLFPDEIPHAIKQDIRMSITSPEDIEWVSKVAMQMGKRAKVHFNIDTGMGRMGILWEEAMDATVNALQHKEINIEGIYSHFANSESRDKNYAYKQLQKFRSIISQLEDRGIKIPMKHMANSGAVLDIPESYFNMVRVGITLYGCYPSIETTESIPLKPVMTLRTKVLLIRRLPKGSNISYGCQYMTDKETNIAVLPIGYADGINRTFTNKGEVLIRDKFYPMVGSVTMDQIMVDVGDDPVEAGDDVIIWGDNSQGSIQLTRIAERVGTVPYELCCAVSKRIPKIYVDI